MSSYIVKKHINPNEEKPFGVCDSLGLILGCQYKTMQEAESRRDEFIRSEELRLKEYMDKEVWFPVPEPKKRTFLDFAKDWVRCKLDPVRYLDRG